MTKKNSKNPETPKNIEGFALRKLGAIIRRERERRRLTQLEIGKRMGKSKIAVHFYETGQRPIHFGTFVKLCAAIRVSPAFILERWQESDVFDVIDEERRKEYHSILDDAIKFGFSRDVDTIFFYLKGLIEKEKEMRERTRLKEQIQKEYYGLKELGKERGDQGDNGI